MIALRRLSLSDRAGRWITERVGRCGCSVVEVAKELGSDWRTVNDALLAYGEALIDDDPTRFGIIDALGLDEVLFVREGEYYRQFYSTQIVNVSCGQLLDVVPGLVVRRSRRGYRLKVRMSQPRALRDPRPLGSLPQRL